MEKAISVVGPTSVGKTQLGISLAKKYNGVIISCDSVQVYKGLSIVSGKDIPPHSEFISLSVSSSELSLGYYLVQGVPIFMVDVVEPERQFSVSDFSSAVQLCLSYLKEQKKTLFFVGGSGLYMDSALNPQDTFQIKPDIVLRKELEKLSVEELGKQLRTLDNSMYATLNNSERNNKRRLVRKIEILQSGFQINNLRKKRKPDRENLFIGLELPKDKLQRKINERIEKRLQQGAVIEAKSLFGNYENLSPQVKNAIGYKDLFRYLNGEVSLDKAIKDWELHEMQFVKKQKTWFQRNKDIKWFDADSDDLLFSVGREIDLFLKA